MPTGFDPAACFTNYRNDGLVYHVGSTVAIPASYSIGGIGGNCGLR